jgi:hypothetical protein
MKSRIATSVMPFFLLCNVAFGAANKQVQEPEYVGNYYALDSRAGNLTPLERKTGECKVKASVFGFGGGESCVEFQGEKSPVRFREGQKLQFVVRVASQQTDPQEIIQFFSLEPKNGRRKVVTVKAKSMGLSAKTVLNEKAITFNATKYGHSSFRIIPEQELHSGEYVLSVPTNNIGFCFGIDPVEGAKEKGHDQE